MIFPFWAHLIIFANRSLLIGSDSIWSLHNRFGLLRRRKLLGVQSGSGADACASGIQMSALSGDVDANQTGELKKGCGSR